MGMKEFYLHEKDAYVGPFCSRRDAERFVALMVTFGQSPEGIEVVELEAGSSAARQRRSKPQNASNLGHAAKFPSRVN